MKIVVFIVSRLWQKVYYLFRQQVRNGNSSLLRLVDGWVQYVANMGN